MAPSASTLSSTFDFDDFLTSNGGTLTRLYTGVEASFIKGGNWVTQRYSWDDLASIDSRLPATVKAMFTDTDNEVNYVSSYWVNNTIKFWKDPTPLRDVNRRAYTVDEVLQVLSFNRLTEVVDLAAVVCKVFTVGGVEYVKHTTNADIKTTSAELEKTFPGWKMRYDVMTALAVEQRELMGTVFTRDKPVLPETVCVAGVTFE